MKNYDKLFFVIILLTSFAAKAQLSLPPGGGSQSSTVIQKIGGVGEIKIEYNSPGVRERKIWGTVVPYGFNNLNFGLSTEDNPSPWRAGANANTTFEFSHDVMISGKELKAGKYGFFLVPNEEGPWMAIFSYDNNHWGSYYYKEENDALRVEVTTKETEFREWLTYEFIDKQNNSATAALIWEEKMIPIKIELKDGDLAHLSAIESELNNSQGFTYQNWQNAAIYASNIGKHDKAIAWAEAAISAPFVGQKNFGTLQVKATVLTNAGKSKEADEIMSEAIKLPDATPGAIHQYGRQLIGAGKNDKALEIFKYNHKTNDGIWPTNYGLARGYSAVGDYKKAIKFLELAKKNLPEGDVVNGPFIEQNLEKLKKGEDIN